jgi:methylmalonyl-CoA mutase cobalamin-binding subunit
MFPAPHPRSSDEAESLHVGGLARQVLAALQTRSTAPQGDDSLCPDILGELVTSVLGLGAFEGRSVVDDFLAAGISQTDLADRFVPAAARHLGDCWIEDDLSFARVTLAAGRLQQMLGELVQANDLLTPSDRMMPGVLVLTARNDQHTLGWKLLTLQIRRRGLAARAVPGVSVDEGAELILQAPYDLVLVSASRLTSVEMVADIVARLRAQLADVPPIVLGGIVTEQIGELCRLPDIDLITNSLDEALSRRRMCRARASRVAAE